MTPEQTETWLDTLSYDSVLEYLAAADYAQHADPVVTFPDVSYTLNGGVLAVEYSGPFQIHAGDFATYTITPDNQEIRGFPILGFWQGLLVGIAAGMATALVLTAL